MRYIAWWCLLIACVCFLFLPVRVQVMVALAGSLWMVYYTIGREMRYIKPVLVAGVWVLVTHWMVLPMALWWHSWQEGAARLMFVFALALGYDLLDRPFDAGRATPTLALHWGSTLTFRVAALALCLMVTIIATMPISGTQKGLETLVPVASIFLMYRISSHPNAAPIPNKIAIDSMMALQILLSLLAS